MSAAPATTPPATTPPRLPALLTPQQLAARSELLQRDYEARAERSSLRGITLRTAAQDMREVLVGLPADAAAAGTVDLPALLGVNDRLRGLGMLMMVSGLVVGVLALALE